MSMLPNFVPSCLFPEIYGPWATRPGFVAQQLETIVAEGFYRSVEISQIHDATDRSDVRSICADHGFYVTAWLTPVVDEHKLDLTSVDETLRQRSVQVIIQHMPQAIEFGAKTIAFVGGTDPGPALRDKGYDSCYKSMSEISAAAADLGATVMLEPLDRFAHKKRLVGPTSEAVAVFARVRAEHPNFGFAFDTAHSALNDEDIGASLALAKDQIAHLHLSNAVLNPSDPLYGDHHMSPGAPGFLTVERTASLLAAAAKLGIGKDRPLRVAVEARAKPVHAEQEVAAIAKVFLTEALEEAYLMKRLKDAFEQNPIVGEVRGVGMLAAVEFVADRGSKAAFDPALKVGARISQAARNRNLIARAMPHGDILGFAPPLVMTEAEIDEMVSIAKSAVDEVLKELDSQGAVKS
ncbi:MAG TPA: aminotransferase class III-fold pyridoxal phosphate-dependent enzyme [Rhizobium sp.]